MLAGITSINRREFDARKDSEETTTNVREVLEASAGKRRAGVPSDPPSSVQADPDDLQADEGSLEVVLRAQVVIKRTAFDEVRSQLADSEDRTSRLRAIELRLMEDVNILEEVLNANYSGDDSTEGPVPEEEPGVEDET